jgi:archaellum component FlaC
MDPELRAYLEERFNSIDQRFDGVDQRFDGIDKRLDRLETRVDGAYLLIEDLRDKIEIVAEGVTGVSERLDRLAAQHEYTNRAVEALELRVRKLEVA